MAEKVFIDLIENLKCVEKAGVVRQLTRHARVVGLDPHIVQDYNAFWEVLENVGIPLPFSKLDTNAPTPPGNPIWSMLRLVNRTASIFDKTNCDVTLEYEHILDGAQLLSDFGSVIYGKMKGSLVQKPTNFWIDWSDPLNPDYGQPQQIWVAYTYPTVTVTIPSNDGVTPAVTVEPDPEFAGQTVVQGGEIQASTAQKTYVLEGFIDTNTPWAIRDGLENRLNELRWMDGAPRTWLCTEVQHQIVYSGLGAITDRHWFHFEFQYDADTWDQQATFWDRRTGQPPVLLQEGVGYFTVPYLLAIDYHTFFPGIIWGDSSTGV